MSQNCNIYIMILIADSGSTKTAWCMADGGKVFYTQGINPFQQTEEDICAVLKHEVLPHMVNCIADIDRIYFYGAGCTMEKSPIVANALRNVLAQRAKIEVESDMLGAARAACGRQRGLVGILGTGSNSCFYDGRELHKGIPALGYVLGDEGSGAYIGRRLVSDVLKHQLSEDVRNMFFEETKENEASIIQKVYRCPFPNRYLASLSPFCYRHRHHPAVHNLLVDCFSQFFIRNILSAPWYADTADNYMHFVGSIAHYYHEELAKAAERHGIRLGVVMQSPLEGLIQYHQS